eukprot:SM005262S17831  [mRNA]  locus=s5262:609:1058:+ [translate_table: standard]
MQHKPITTVTGNPAAGLLLHLRHCHAGASQVSPAPAALSSCSWMPLPLSADAQWRLTTTPALPLGHRCRGKAISPELATAAIAGLLPTGSRASSCRASPASSAGVPAPRGPTPWQGGR